MSSRITEKSKEKKSRASLAGKAVRGTVLSCVLLGLLAMVIGLGLYGSTLVKRSISRAYETASKAVTSATHGADPITLAKDVMGVYRSLTPEQRAQNGTEEGVCTLVRHLRQSNVAG